MKKTLDLNRNNSMEITQPTKVRKAIRFRFPWKYWLFCAFLAVINQCILLPTNSLFFVLHKHIRPNDLLDTPWSTWKMESLCSFAKSYQVCVAFFYCLWLVQDHCCWMRAKTNGLQMVALHERLCKKRSGLRYNTLAALLRRFSWKSARTLSRESESFLHEGHQLLRAFSWLLRRRQRPVSPSLDGSTNASIAVFIPSTLLWTCCHVTTIFWALLNKKVKYISLAFVSEASVLMALTLFSSQIY